MPGVALDECNSHPRRMKIIKEDYERFYVEKPDPHFNPDHNKKVIEQSIKKKDKQVKESRKKFTEGIGERVDMAASYMVSDKSKSIDKYLGKKIMARLAGERFLEHVKSMRITNPTITQKDVVNAAKKQKWTLNPLSSNDV